MVQPILQSADKNVSYRSKAKGFPFLPSFRLILYDPEDQKVFVMTMNMNVWTVKSILKEIMEGDAKYLKRKVKAGRLDVHPSEKAKWSKIENLF